MATMTGRYTRQTIPLEIRGISHEKPEDASELIQDKWNYDPLVARIGSDTYATNSQRDLTSPTSFILRNYGYVDGPEPSASCPNYSSGRSSPNTESEAMQSIVSMSNGFTTGYTTERSSIYSFDDEFDKQGSRRVHQFFKEIDSMLFEDSHGAKHLQSECKDWTTSFPHLRIMGKQIGPVGDLGLLSIPSDSPRSASEVLQDITDQDINQLSQGIQSMCLMGHKVSAQPIPRDLVNFSGQDNDTPVYQEEIIAQDGDYEDVIAIDRSTEDEYGNDTQMLFPRKKKGALPPVTPHACVKDNIGASSFDFVWSEIISWVQPLLRQYKEQTDQDGVEEEIVDIVERENSQSPLANKDLPSSLTPTTDRPPSRETSQLSSRPDKSRLSAKPNKNRDNLMGGLLTISSKPVLNRDKPAPLDSVDQFNTNYSSRPGSMLGERLDRRYRPLSTSTQSQRINSARGGRIPPRTNRLAPLRDDRAKTPSIDDERQHSMLGEVLRGKGYQMTDDSSPPPMSLSRAGPLPPINVDSMDFTTSAKRKSQLRIRSAIAEETRVPYRDQENPGLHLNMRPSTTQTFRVSNQSDLASSGGIINRRSSTPMGFSKNASGVAQAPSTSNPSTANPATTGMLNLNVTGSGMMKQDPDQEHYDESDVMASHWDNTYDLKPMPLSPDATNRTTGSALP